MNDIFYTKEQKLKLIDLQNKSKAKQEPISMAVGLAILDALGEQQNTLQSISEIAEIIAEALIERKGDQPEVSQKPADQRMKKGDVYYADLGENIGSEQSGRRPVVIMQNDTGNAYSPTVTVVPATSRKKHNIPTHVPARGEDGLDENTVFLAEQVRTVDKKRLKKFVCRLSKESVGDIERAILTELGIKIQGD